VLDAGLCRLSSSPWANPLHPVPKKEDDWRLCDDYWRLNKITVSDRCPILHLHDFAYNLEKSTIFAILDLTKAYHQIPITEKDRTKTAVITTFGLFEYII